MPGVEQKTNQKIAPNHSFFHTKQSVLWGGFFIAILYWLVDSLFCFFTANGCSLWKTLFDPNMNNLYKRIIVLCIIVIFASHQRRKIKEKEEELGEWVTYSKYLEKRIRSKSPRKPWLGDW